LRTIFLVLALGLVLACKNDAIVIPDGGCGLQCLLSDGGPPERQHEQIYELNPSRDLDILVLVDNSASTKEATDNLRRNFPVFLDELKKLPGGLPDLHIGVVSSDLGAGSMPLGNGGCARPGGDRGIFQTKPSCGLVGSNFLSSSSNGTMNNFPGDISTVFSCMADLGVAGCGYEHQLQATRVALYESITPENRGFLRSEAFLAIVLLTDEDDCSAEPTSNLFTDDAAFPMTSSSFRCAQTGHLCEGKEPPIAPFDAPLESCTARDGGRLIKVSELVASIRNLKKRPDQQIAVSGIFGWPRFPAGARYKYVGTMVGTDVGAICSSSNGDAAVGLRMKAFVESFGAAGSFFSVCQDDYAPTMKQIGERVASQMNSRCINAPVVDTQADQPGVQADCQVIDRIPASVAGGYQDQPVPPCSSGGRSASGACWQLVVNLTCSTSGLQIDVDRGGKLPVPGAQQVIRCATCSGPADPRCRR
jgi:hypothetical protein